MRIERVERWPAVPGWAVLLGGVYLSLVGLWTWAGRNEMGDRPTVCMFRRVTGRPCPTCGTTRLVIAAGTGKLHKAAAHNPFVFALAVVGLALLAMRVGFRRRVVWITSPVSRRIVTATLLLALLANWLYLLVVF